MKKTVLVLSVLAPSLDLTLSLLSTTAVETSSVTTAQQMPSFASTFEKMTPSVVSISVEGNTTVNTLRMPRSFQQFFDDGSPFYQEGLPFQNPSFCQRGLGDNGGGQQQRFMMLGSDVIIDADKGYVIANNHAVDNAIVTKAQLSGGRKFNAKVVGKDPCSSIALIQIQDPRSLTVIKMADSDTLRVGDYIVAISNPFGLGKTTTSRTVPTLGHSGLSAENYENFIQTDAAISRGNSGSMLVNLNSELVGINTAILVPDDRSTGIGSTIPSNMVKNLTPQMMEYDQAEYGELDIIGAELSSDLTEAMKVNAQRDAFVSQVLPNSFIAKAGTKAGNVITSLNGKPIGSFAVLRAQVGTMPVGNKLTLGLLCDGKQANMNLELQQSSQNQVDSSTVSSSIEGVGMSNEGKDQDVVMNNVKTGAPVAQTGLEKGDVIIGASQQVVKNIAELCKVLDSKLSMLVLNIQHDDSAVYPLIQ